MTKRKLIYFMSGQLGVMLLARFFFQWILDYSSQPLSSSSSALSVGEASAMTGVELTLFSASAVGALLLVFRIFDGITDPIAGAFCDGWVARGQERRRLLWYTAWLPALGLTLCFLPSTEMSVSIRWLILGLGMFVFFVGYTLYAIPYWSLVGDYATGDHSRRNLLSTLLGVGMLLATAVGFIVTPMMIDQWGYLMSAGALAIVSIPLMVAPYFASPNDLSPLLPPSHTGQKDPFPPGSMSQWINLKRALKHKRFRATLCLFTGSQMSFTVMTAAAPFIAVDLLGGSTSDVALLLGPLLGFALPASIALPWVSRKFGWERGVMWACLGLGIIYLGAGGLGRAVIGTPLTSACILFSLGGPMVAVLLGLEGEAITACADDHGGDSVGIYFGVYNFVVKGFNGVAIALTSIFASWARADGADGAWAVRLMGMSAGVLLLIGLLAYACLKPRAGDEETP